MNQVKTTSGKFTPPQFSEVILKTANFAAMKDWYETVTDVKAFFVRDDAKAPNWTGAYSIAFIRIFADHPYTQVLGLFEVPEISSGNPRAPGLNHMQFREASLENLFLRYEMLRSKGVLPFKSYNHGPGSSFYYRDPDGNEVELSATNFANQEDYLAFMRSEAFRGNVEGHAVDAQRYIAEVRAARGMSNKK